MMQGATQAAEYSLLNVNFKKNTSKELTFLFLHQIYKFKDFQWLMFIYIYFHKTFKAVFFPSQTYQPWRIFGNHDNSLETFKLPED